MEEYPREPGMEGRRGSLPDLVEGASQAGARFWGSCHPSRAMHGWRGGGAGRAPSVTSPTPSCGFLVFLSVVCLPCIEDHLEAVNSGLPQAVH